MLVAGGLRVGTKAANRSIVADAGPGTNLASGFNAAPGAGSGDDPAKYLGRLTALFPAEALSLYGLGQGIFGVSGHDLAIAACVSLLVLLVLRYNATKTGSGNSPQFIAIAIAAVSFVLWISTIGGSFDFLHVVPWGLDSKWAAFIAAAWTTLVPIFYKGDR